ncbi:1-acyl-sn-glycerol-3-phosphate acyltransferase [uncultured Treponema sp.]|uniref:lysophospholipid acyltransferase family protein n=1 Tax=uncultured Treponema sp. TaxID=162155 RepID=UPI0025F85D9A|nr:lysophospholipid acyltransferase family protein [uncultured Treponema sp.]
MFTTFFSFLRIALYMLSKNKLRRLALKYDKAGDIAKRDEVVFGIVPQWARFVFTKVMRATVEVVGEEKVPQDRAVVFIGNHQGYMDIPLLFGFINKPMTFVAKAELGKVPLLSDWMKLLQCTFIERKSPRKSVQAIHDAADGVKKGYSQVIFPEGTRSKGGPHNEFKAGSFKLAFMSGAPIVPVTIDGTWRIYEGQKRVKKGQHIKLIIHDPIETEGLSKEELAKIPAMVEKIVCEPLEN